jgi:hypothetical protein
MKEKIVKLEKSPLKNKKYLAYVKNNITNKIRKLHFGSSEYPQYKDITKLKIYSKWDHLDRKRRRNYFMRHSGLTTKSEALKKEIESSKGFYTSKILSHKFLW